MPGSAQSPYRLRPAPAAYTGRMKVLNLRCSNGHAFEGWFQSEDDFAAQTSGGLLQCPVCSHADVARMPSAPRLNLSGARAEPATRAARPDEASPPAGAAAAGAATSAVLPAELQAAWLQAVRQLVQSTEDVGTRFAEEARRIHYGESEQRGIRGQATPQEREALLEEGIETVAIALPLALKEPLQ